MNLDNFMEKSLEFILDRKLNPKEKSQIIKFNYLMLFQDEVPFPMPVQQKWQK